MTITPPALKTRVSDQLGIRYPVIQGGMQWVGTAEMASAVSNAGGLGILTAGCAELLERMVGECRERLGVAAGYFAS